MATENKGAWYLTYHYQHDDGSWGALSDSFHVGDTIDFYTTNHNYQLVSPTSDLTYQSDTYYTKDGTKYTLLTNGSNDSNKWDDAITNHKNIYKRDHTEDVQCPVCKGYKKLFYRTGETSSSTTNSYKCPRCDGEGTLIKATDVKITAISVFYPSYGKRKVSYQVIPPGGVTSVLIPRENIIECHCTHSTL